MLVDFVMAVFNVFNDGSLVRAINSSFLMGVLFGVSLAWVFLKSRYKIRGENTVFSSDDSSTCGEVSCMTAVVFYSKSALCFGRILITVYCVSAVQM